MTSFYDEIEIEDMDFDAEQGLYTFPCPCGDLFQISLDELREGEDIARCPSCTLIIRIIYDPEEFIDQDLEVVSGGGGGGGIAEVSA